MKTRLHQAFLTHAAWFAALTVLYAGLALLCLHAVAEYPGFLLRARQSQQEAAIIFESVCGGGTQPRVAFHHLDCGHVAAEAQASVHARAAHHTLEHMAADLNVLRWVGCTPGSLCTYWAAKLFDTVLTYLYAFLPVGMALLALYLWNALQMHRIFSQWQMVQAQERFRSQVHSADATHDYILRAIGPLPTLRHKEEGSSA